MTDDTYTPSDDVAAQLRDLERQGGGMARLAHLCAGLLLAAFSLGSLISLSLAAFYKFMAEWNIGRFDMPDAINMAVNVLLVLAMDIAMLYAASVIRIFSAAGAPPREQRIHRVVIAVASVVESTTYLYMLWRFDRPTDLWLWGIGFLRALSAPGFAAYLSMARALPVAPRDIMYHSALASGKGVVRDVATLSADPTAPLEHKVRIFRAASQMSPTDRSRLDTRVHELSIPNGTIVEASPSSSDRPPTGPGAPALTVGGSNGLAPALERLRREPAIQLVDPDAGTRRRHRTASAEARVRKLLAREPDLAAKEIARRLRISDSTASKYRRLIESETEERGQAAQ